MQPGQQRWREVDLGVDRVVVGDDRQPDLGDLAVVSRSPRARRPRYAFGGNSITACAPASAACSVQPSRLVGAVRGNSGHDGESDGSTLSIASHDARSLVGSQGLVLAERAVGRDAVAATIGEEAHVLGKCIEIDAAVFRWLPDGTAVPVQQERRATERSACWTWS